MGRDVAIGYAADRRGHGIAYARVTTSTSEHVLRLTFRVNLDRSSGEMLERQIGYAATTAVANELRRRGVRRAAFAIPDASLLTEIRGGGAVPQELVLAHLRLRCALNAFERCDVRVGESPDLTQRARAEVALHHAA
jgi:hypothetical protein